MHPLPLPPAHCHTHLHCHCQRLAEVTRLEAAAASRAAATRAEAAAVRSAGVGLAERARGVQHEVQWLWVNEWQWLVESVLFGLGVLLRSF
jgi:hypothetical protein